MPPSASAEPESRVRRISEPPRAAANTTALEDGDDTERLREERDRLLRIAAVNELLPSILHELKNPLAAISAVTELLIEEAESEATRRTALAILNQVRRMKLNLDGIGAVGRSLRSARNSAVDHVIREAFVVLEPQARAKGIHARCQLADMPLLPLDPSVVSAVTFNLLNNAIQACNEGDAIAISAQLDEGDREFVLRVEDTGPGMSPEVLARCRELFYTTKRSGTGIGLTLCERAVSEAGGKMDIESAPGRGTQITLRVPVARR